MVEDKVKIPTSAGTAEGVVCSPGKDGRWPGVIFYTDIVGHAIKDKGMPAEAIERLDQALAAWRGKYESEVYEGAFHGWTVPDSPVYGQPQAERAFEKLTQIFVETIG